VKRHWVFLSAVVLLASTALGAFAGEGGHEASGGHAGGVSQAQLILLCCAIINFGLFVYLMRRFTGGPISDFLRARRARVREAMEAAAEAKREAERMKAEYGAKDASLDRTRSEMIEEMRAIAEADRAKTIAAVTEASERLLRDAERTAENDLARAKRELRAETAMLATEAASREITERLGAADRQRLLNDFLKGVDRQR